MNLHSGDPYWLIKNGFLYSYPSLQQNRSCDVLIIGAGITGALVAHYVQKTGAKIIVVDRRHVGIGSTAASTALLQYEIDTHLVDLIKKIGQEHAERSYLCCVRAIGELQKIAEQLPLHCQFRKKKSLYLASIKAHAAILEKEYEARKKIGIKLRKLDTAQLEKMTGLDNALALYSEDAAEMDPVRFTHGIFQQLIDKGCEVYDQTEIRELHESPRKAVLRCANGSMITCKKIIFANGYESQLYLEEQKAILHSTYSIISKPLPRRELGLLKPLIWESARPYLYIRTTADGRVIIGGKDEKFYSPHKRDMLLRKKAKALEQAFRTRFPSVPFETDFAWTGTFAETKDGLPYIGKTKEYKHAYFAMGFGGNGIVFSQVAGELIAELIEKGKSENEELFSFNR